MIKKKNHESHEPHEPHESHKPDIIEISTSQLQALKEKLDNDRQNLTKEDVSKLKALIDTVSYVHDLIKKKNVEINKLRMLLIGTPTSEKSKNLLFTNNDDDNDKREDSDSVAEESENEKVQGEGVLNGESVGDADGDSDADSEAEAAVKVKIKSECQSKKKGHGKNGVSVYTGAERKAISHPFLQAGSKCPECPAGCLYKLKPSVILRITGNVPLSSTIYEMERYRCSSCGAIFTAPIPLEAGTEKYDAASCANVCLLKYGNGFAFNRLEKFQENMGVPLSASTQWEMVLRQKPFALYWQLYHEERGN